MHRSSHFKRFLAVLAAAVGLVLVPAAALADPAFYLGPLFGTTTAPDGRLLVADTGQGIVNGDDGSLIAELPGVAAVAAAGNKDLWALGNQKLYRVVNGVPSEVADLGAYEAKKNPHPTEVDSNPFDVADLGDGGAVVADAGGNDLLEVGKHGTIKLVGVLPDELVSTENLKSLAGCPAGPPDFCDLPPMIPAEAVATSVAIGPDGTFYVGELKGFPAPVGESRVWSIEPGHRGAKSWKAQCGVSKFCSVALDGFTSIIDLAFGPDGRLYVAQFDDASWAAVEIFQGAGALGGSVHACDLTTKACEEVVSGVPMLASITFRQDGSLWGATQSLAPGLADVVELAPAP